MKRKFYFRKPEHVNCYRTFIVEAAHSDPDDRAYVEVLQHREDEDAVSFCRRGGDWYHTDVSKVKEMNEIEAICIRVAEKWRAHNGR